MNKSGVHVKIVDINGWTSTVHVGSDGCNFSPSVKLLWDHFKSCLTHCLNIEATMEQMSLSTEEDVFPIIIGRRPPSSQRALQTSNKENMSPISAISVPVVRYNPYIIVIIPIVNIFSSIQKTFKMITLNVFLN